MQYLHICCAVVQWTAWTCLVWIPTAWPPLMKVLPLSPSWFHAQLLPSMFLSVILAFTPTSITSGIQSPSSLTVLMIEHLPLFWGCLILILWLKALLVYRWHPHSLLTDARRVFVPRIWSMAQQGLYDPPEVKTLWCLRELALIDFEWDAPKQHGLVLHSKQAKTQSVICCHHTHAQTHTLFSEMTI